MRIVVVGAGIGGLALARGLGARGHEVTVHERAHELRREGAGLTLYPNGTAVLESLDVDVTGLGRRLEEMRVRAPDGAPRSTLDLDALARALGHDVRQVPRRNLLEALAAGLPGGVLRFDQACAAVRETAAGPVVTFADGDTVHADVVVGADGVRSRVRQELWGAPDVRETGWASWIALTKLPWEFADTGIGFLTQGPDRMSSALPAGNGLVQWWFTVPWGPGVPIADSPLAEIRAMFGEWADPDVRTLLEHARDEDLAPFPHVRGSVRRSWGRGAVTLLGDAAHPFPPSTGQGANQALEDAWALTVALSDSRAFTNPAEALRRYERARYPKAARASAASAQEAAQQYPMPLISQAQADRLVTQTFTLYVRSVSTILKAERKGARLR